MPSDSYGKMRVCTYYPISLVERDNNGDIIDEEIPDGFEDDFLGRIIYSGYINNEDSSNFKFEIPNCPEINPVVIGDRLLQIKDSLNNKIVE